MSKQLNSILFDALCSIVREYQDENDQVIHDSIREIADLTFDDNNEEEQILKSCFTLLKNNRVEIANGYDSYIEFFNMIRNDNFIALTPKSENNSIASSASFDGNDTNSMGESISNELLALGCDNTTNS